MDAKEKLSYEAREAKIEALLLEAAELKIDGMVEEGVFLETPHYCIIEAQARTLGNQLSQRIAVWRRESLACLRWNLFTRRRARGKINASRMTRITPRGAAFGKILSWRSSY